MNTILSCITQHKYLALVLALFLFISALFVAFFQSQQIWGDEVDYIAESNRDISLATRFKQQLPGTMIYIWWPPYTASFYSIFSTEKLRSHYAKRKILPPDNLLDEQNRFIRRASFVNIFLFLILGSAIYAAAGFVGMSRGWSAISAALVLFNPRMMFYIQTMWPEILHSTMFMMATMFYMFFIRKKKMAYLVLAGLLYGYCSLTKGIVDVYIYLLAAHLPIYCIDTDRKSIFMIPLVVFIFSYGIVISTQKYENLITHGDYAISTNKWINIEVGLDQEASFYRYSMASNNPREREELSKQRVLKHLESATISTTLNHQVDNYIRLLNNSFFKSGVSRGRWRNADSLSLLTYVDTFLSWSLFILGVISLLRNVFSNAYKSVIGVFLLYYLGSLLIVGFNARFFVQAIPPLAIFSTLILKDCFDKLSPRLSP